MKKNHRYIVLLLMAVFVCSIFTGCSKEVDVAPPAESSTEATNQYVPDKQQLISMVSGATGGTYHMVISGMSSMIDKYATNVSASVITGTSGSENFKLVGSGDAQIGIGSADTALAAYAGEREFESALTNLRWLSKGYSSLMHIVVLNNSPFQSIEDLRGKRVASYAGSAAEFQVPAIMEAYGMVPDVDYKKMPMGIGDAASALRDGQIDAIMQFGGLPLSAITDLASTKGIRLLEIPTDKLTQIQQKHIWMSTETIPAGTYKGVDVDIQTAGQIICLFTSEDVSDAIVYQAMTAIMDNNEELSAIHPSAGYFNLKSGYEGAGSILPIHPAAEQFYKDKGVIK